MVSASHPARPARPPRGERGAGIGRAIGYLTHYKKLAFFAYGALIVSTAAQLMVPQVIQNIIDVVTNGMIAQQLAKVPAAFLPTALTKLRWTMEQYNRFSNDWSSAMISAGLLIVLFAIM